MVKLIPGSTPDPFRRSRGILSNGYLIGATAVDAPEGAKPPKADLLIITHPHCDHFYSAASYSCETAASEFAYEAINEKRDDICLCSLANFSGFPGVKIDSALKDGEIINKGGVSLEVIYTPGHADGAICLYEHERKILFSGDTVFPDYMLPNTSLPTSDISKLKDSYEKLSIFEIDIIYPGHGAVIREKDYIKTLIKLL